MFKEMFQASSAPSNEDEMEDGLPVIRVHESAEQLEYILRYCYNLDSPDLTQKPFDFLEKALDCSIKYGNKRAADAVCFELQRPSRVKAEGMSIWLLGHKYDLDALIEGAEASASFVFDLGNPLSLVATVGKGPADDLHCSAIEFCTAIHDSDIFPDLSISGMARARANGTAFDPASWGCSKRHPKIAHTDLIQVWHTTFNRCVGDLWAGSSRNSFKLIFGPLKDSVDSWCDGKDGSLKPTDACVRSLRKRYNAMEDEYDRLITWYRDSELENIVLK